MLGNEEGGHERGYGNPLHFLHNFSVNLKLPTQSKSIKKNKSSQNPKEKILVIDGKIYDSAHVVKC